jgi:hypothetical protein
MKALRPRATNSDACHPFGVLTLDERAHRAGGIAINARLRADEQRLKTQARRIAACARVMSAMVMIDQPGVILPFSLPSFCRASWLGLFSAPQTETLRSQRWFENHPQSLAGSAVDLMRRRLR